MTESGHEADHVLKLGLATAADGVIWDEARTRNAALITKDRDFATLRIAKNAGPPIIWLRFGNCDTDTLIRRVIGSLDLIVTAVERGERWWKSCHVEGWERPESINPPLTTRGHLAAMVSRRRARGILTALGLYVVAAALIGYFGFHAFSGQRGLRARHQIDQQMAELTAELDRLKAERAHWDRKVALLRPDRIDPDTLDERARALLNLAHPNDLVMMVKRR